MSSDAYSGTDQTADEPVYIQGQSHFEEVVSENDVVLVDFFATWCGPCQMLEPVMEQLATETDATVAKVDVDDNQPLAGSFGVRGVPTIMVFADGEQVEQQVGALPADRLRSLVEGYTNE
ncbi:MULTISPECIES: thioredoxin [Natronosalvus]|uniref:Thioredoxin n=1 Tax=Natronosalvus rutilus TaxID=2953753 RepID=A0A9E7N7X6_9EURY|nr:MULTISPECIES: thioredoxin [Natronosalvus]USZ72196.1 thioredoxin [Natronosalvus halobius]UTF52189.1 thioredoxin [Natronosalvus rutilus]